MWLLRTTWLIRPGILRALFGALGSQRVKNSRKKCHELDKVIAALMPYLEPGDLPDEGGSRPSWACGTRLVSHKGVAIGRLIDRYGAYLPHLTTVTEDSSVRAVDRQKLKGYVFKWSDCNMILGCA